MSKEKTDTDKGNLCPICLDINLKATTASVFKCGHAFCNTCVVQLGCAKPQDSPRSSDSPCPICKHPLGFSYLFLDNSIVTNYSSSSTDEACLMCHNKLNEKCITCEINVPVTTTWNPCNSVKLNHCGNSLHRHCLQRWLLCRKQCPFPSCELPIPALFE